MPSDVRRRSAYLREVLVAAQAERDQRPDLVDGVYGPECEWAVYERQVMHEAVNKLRAGFSLPPVPLTAVERVEQLAVGHSDYTAKFSFYCAELAEGVTNVRA